MKSESLDKEPSKWPWRLKFWCWPKRLSRCNFVSPQSGWVTCSNIILIAFPFGMALYRGFSDNIDEWFVSKPGLHVFLLTSVYLIMLIATLIKMFNLIRDYCGEYSPDGSSEIAVVFKACAYTQYDLYNTLNTANNANTLGKLEDRATMVIISLRKHMEKTINKISNADKQVNVTVYLVKGLLNKTHNEKVFEGFLSNLTSIDPARFPVNSKEIDVTSEDHADYECSKCIVNKESIIIQLNKAKYKKTMNKRSGKVENYFGMMLLDKEDNLLGFLNIEIHNVPCFENEDDAQEYLLEEILVFKHALEYHIIAEKTKIRSNAA